MPVRDAGNYIDACITSLREQSLDAYEVVVVDDGSVDGTGLRLKAWARRDQRVRILRQDARGIVAALNSGLEQCRAPLIARMDADDVMHPRRLQSLHDAFDREPEVGLVASRVHALTATPLRAGMREYLNWQNGLLTPAEIAADIFWEAPFTHPSVAFRKATLSVLGGYRDGLFPEDYDLWLRAHAAGIRMRKLSAKLIQWRVHETSASHTDERCARRRFDEIRQAYLAAHLRRYAESKRVIVWGAGRRTRQRIGALAELGVDITAWIDIDARKLGRRLSGKPVFPPAWLRQQRGRVVVLGCVTSHGARELIASAVAAMGYKRGQDFWPVG